MESSLPQGQHQNIADAQHKPSRAGKMNCF
jgi:hypothetical protein